MQNRDKINPEYYHRCNIECKDLIKAYLGTPGYIFFCKGNVLKYVFRHQGKNGVEDLKKAARYIEMAKEVMPSLDEQIMELTELVEKYGKAYSYKPEIDEDYTE